MRERERERERERDKQNCTCIDAHYSLVVGGGGDTLGAGGSTGGSRGGTKIPTMTILYKRKQCSF